MSLAGSLFLGPGSNTTTPFDQLVAQYEEKSTKSPPPGSWADDIPCSVPSLQRRASTILSEMIQMSDFGSCLSSMSSSSEENDDNLTDASGGWVTKKGKKKGKKKKRKASETPPGRNNLLKKQNSVKSPLLKKLD